MRSDLSKAGCSPTASIASGSRLSDTSYRCMAKRPIYVVLGDGLVDQLLGLDWPLRSCTTYIRRGSGKPSCLYPRARFVSDDFSTGTRTST